jgi:hypothetical protein
MTERVLTGKKENRAKEGGLDLKKHTVNSVLFIKKVLCCTGWERFKNLREPV